MSALLILAANAWREQLRGRFFSVVVVFGCVTLYVSTMLGMLAADQERRALMDFGLAFIEVAAAAAAAFAAATGLLQEMQAKTIYLVLTRPVPRSAYLAGRTLGLLAAALCAAALMAAAHLALLLAKGWAWDWAYPLALAGIALKLVVMVPAATLLALVSTSAFSSLLMTAIVWALGHFVAEMRFLAERSPSAAAKALGLLVHLAPNLQLLNFRDLPGAAGGVQALQALLYAPLYASACLAAALAFFRRREF